MIFIDICSYSVLLLSFLFICHFFMPGYDYENYFVHLILVNKGRHFSHIRIAPDPYVSPTIWMEPGTFSIWFHISWLLE